jgi:hypothetical protein
MDELIIATSVKFFAGAFTDRGESSKPPTPGTERPKSFDSYSTLGNEENVAVLKLKRIK